MGYRTQASEDFMDRLQRRDAMLSDRLRKAEEQQREPFDRGYYAGMVAATKLAIEDATDALPQVEAEAALVPEFEVEADRFLADVERAVNSYMAGDLRDFPA